MLGIKCEIRYICTNQKTKGVTSVWGNTLNCDFSLSVMFLSASYQKENSLSELLRDPLQKIAGNKAENHVLEI